MSARIETRYPVLEDALEQLFRIDPDEAFVARVERELSTLPRRRPPQARTWGVRLRWALALGAAALLFALAVIGPDRVLATVQRWLNYVPGIGFIELEGARVLAAPASVTRDGVTVTVVSLVATQDRTHIAFEVQGLGPQPYRGTDLGGAPRVQLILPRGQVLDSQDSSMTLTRSHYTFAPLPTDAATIRLRLSHLPLVVDPVVPTAWEIPLALRANEPGLLPPALYPQSYDPEVSVTREGLTLRITHVAHSPEGTLVRVQATWPAGANPLRVDLGAQMFTTRLADNVGHESHGPLPPDVSGGGSSGMVVGAMEVVTFDSDVPTPTLPAIPTYEEDLLFAPLSLTAERLTFSLDQVIASAPIRAAPQIELDLGPDPRVGDTWPLDVTLEAPGASIRLVEAAIVANAGTPPQRMLIIRGQPVESAGDGTRITGVDFNLVAPSGTEPFSCCSASSAWMATDSIAYGFLGQGESGLSGRIVLQPMAADVLLPGPWTLRWDIPTRTPVAQPLVTRLAVSDTHQGITVQVTGVTRTDQITAIDYAVTGLPQGARFVQPQHGLSSDPTTWFAGGIRYDDHRGDLLRPNRIGWAPFSEASRQGTSVGLAGPVLSPDVDRLTVTLPALEIAWPGHQTVTVSVPSGLTFQQTVPESPFTFSDAWGIDASVRFGPHVVSFNQARLQEESGHFRLQLISPNALANNYVLLEHALETDSLQVAHFGWAPVQQAYFSAATQSLPPDLGVDLVLPNTEDATYRPGTYAFVFLSLHTGIPGPWVLDLPLR